MKKNLVACLFLLCMAMILTACGGDDITTQSTTTAATTTKVTTTERPGGFDNFVISQGARIEVLDATYLTKVSPAWSVRVCKSLDSGAVQTLETMLQEKTWTEAQRATEGYDVVFDLFTEETTNLYWYYVDFESKTVLRIAALQVQGTTDGKSTLSDADLQGLLSVLQPFLHLNKRK